LVTQIHGDTVSAQGGVPRYRNSLHMHLYAIAYGMLFSLWSKYLLTTPKEMTIGTMIPS